MKSLMARMLGFVFLLSACWLPTRGLSRVQSPSGDLPKDLVFVGTVTKIYPVASSHSRRNWAVVTHVDKLVSGAFSDPSFTFTVHSPAQAGLRVGHPYTIKAVWSTDGYIVNEFGLKGNTRSNEAAQETLTPSDGET